MLQAMQNSPVLAAHPDPQLPAPLPTSAATIAASVAIPAPTPVRETLPRLPAPRDPLAAPRSSAPNRRAPASQHSAAGDFPAPRAAATLGGVNQGFVGHTATFRAPSSPQDLDTQAIEAQSRRQAAEAIMVAVGAGPHAEAHRGGAPSTREPSFSMEATAAPTNDLLLKSHWRLLTVRAG